MTPAASRLRDQIASNPGLNCGAEGLIPTVLIPVHNAFDELVECLESVVRHTRDRFALVIVNDGSTDRQVAQLLEALHGAASGIVVRDRAVCEGFVRTINEGVGLSAQGHVVILNSDTVVTRGWLQNLLRVAGLRDDVATVTPLTNNGTICSVPVPMAENAIPDGYDIDSFAGLIERTTLRILPEVPTGVGFCMLVTRRALDTLGGFDQSFGHGYAEENDFCLRARDAGLVNLIADDTFVYHKGRSSFQDRSDGLISDNLRTLAARYPGYLAEITAISQDHPLRLFHSYLKARLAVEPPTRPARVTRVMHVLHHGGGTEKHARDLASIPDDGIESYVLCSDGRAFRVDEYYRGTFIRRLAFPLRHSVSRCPTESNPSYGETLGTVLRLFHVDLLHVHHLMYHTLDLATVAGACGIPFVFTFHDYFTVCPNYTLLGPEGAPCRTCLGASSARRAVPCSVATALGVSDLEDYRLRMRTFLEGAADLFAPSACTAALLTRWYPRLQAIEVIEHGHWAKELEVAVAPPAGNLSDRTLNVAVLGGLTLHKGLSVFQSMLRLNRRTEIVFHLYGITDDPGLERIAGRAEHVIDGSRVIHHGRYESRSIAHALRADGIHVGLQLSIWAETFSYTLSELVAAGVPVIVGELGAQGERTRAHSLGWTVEDIRRPEQTLNVLYGLLDDPESLTRAADAVRREEALMPIEMNWRTYAAAYRAHGRSAKTGEPRSNDDGNSDDAYLQFVAMRLAEVEQEPEQRHLDRAIQAEVEALRSRLRSPRHRIADAAGNLLQRVPVIWPAVAWATDTVLRWQRRRDSGRA